MKKIIGVLLTVLFLTLGANVSQAVEEPTGVTFIYINGSNNLAYNHRLKFKTAFIDDVKTKLFFPFIVICFPFE